MTGEPLTCALCGKETRSLYGLPGDRVALMCARCFFPAIKPVVKATS